MTSSPIRWIPNYETDPDRWVGVVPQVGHDAVLFWLVRAEFLSHWAAPGRYRWTLKSHLPGLDDLNITAEGRDVPPGLFASAEQARLAYVARLNGETL